MSAAQQERTERLQVVLPGDELAAIDDFRFKTRCRAELLPCGNYFAGA